MEKTSYYYVTAIIILLLFICLSLLRQYQKDPTQALDFEKTLREIALFHLNREKFLNETFRNPQWRQ